MQSKRKDGRGHWPRGKRRHADKGNWSRVRLSLTQFVDDHWRYQVITQRVLANDLGVDPRTLKRWLVGEDRPPVEMQEAAQAWLAEKREAERQRREAERQKREAERQKREAERQK